MVTGTYAVRLGLYTGIVKTWNNNTSVKPISLKLNDGNSNLAENKSVTALSLWQHMDAAYHLHLALFVSSIRWK